MTTEYEIKFVNIDTEDIRSKLVSFHAIKVHGQVLMRRQVFDFPKSSPIKQWIRVRDEGNKVTLTLKKVMNSTAIEGTQELEFQVESFEKACDFLKLSGFIQGPYQENYRESWSYANTQITIDTWPGLSPFLEIEGENELIVRDVAQKLGFDYKLGIFGPVDSVYAQILGISGAELNKIQKLTFDSAFLPLKKL